MNIVPFVEVGDGTAFRMSDGEIVELGPKVNTKGREKYIEISTAQTVENGISFSLYWETNLMSCRKRSTCFHG